MFWFVHPKPFSQKPVAMQIVQRKTAALRQAGNLIIVERAPPDALPDEDAAISPTSVTPKSQ